MKALTHRKISLAVASLFLAFGFAAMFSPGVHAATDPTCQAGQGHCNPSNPSNGGNGNGGNQSQTQPNGTFNTGDNTDLGDNPTGKPTSTKATHDTCGAGDNAVAISINIGCRGKGNPITDMLFAIIRILSDGVGLVVIGSIIVGGIQYTGSRGDPQSTAMAVNRIRSSVFALIIFIFGYAILNFIIPQGFFN